MRWTEFIVQLEYNECDLSLAELQEDFNAAIESQNYEAAAMIKKKIDNYGKEDEIQYINEKCFINLDDVCAFHQSQYANGDKLVKVYLKSGDYVPIAITINEFEKIFFNK